VIGFRRAGRVIDEARLSVQAAPIKPRDIALAVRALQSQAVAADTRAQIASVELAHALTCTSPDAPTWAALWETLHTAATAEAGGMRATAKKLGDKK
jgi:hypothetical protein